MIERLTKRNMMDVYEFVQRVKDRFQDFYITHDNQRLFLTDFKAIKKLLEKQEVYSVYDKGVKGLMIIYKEKGFRPYIKLLTETRRAESSLIKYLMMNFSEQDLYIKVKKENPLAKYIKYFGFIQTGDRGLEILLFRKGIRILHKMLPKDLLLNDDEERLY
jgi:hypothetical protein